MDWPVYDKTTRPTLELDLTSHVVDNPYGPLLRAWDRVPFDGLKPSIDQTSGLMTMDGGGNYFKWTETDQ